MNPTNGPFRAIFVILAAFVGTLIVCNSVFAASFQVSPTRFKFPLKRRFTNFFTLTNISEKSLRVRVYARFVIVDADNKIIEKVGHPHDLSRWTVFNPRQLTIRPKQKRTMRFSVRPPRNLEEGEYRGVIFFEELPSGSGSVPGAGGQNEVRLRLNLLTRVGVTLYGMIGKRRIDLRAEVEPIIIDPQTLLVPVMLENAGNAHLPIAIAASLLDGDGNVVFEAKSSIVVHRSQKRRWNFRMKKPTPGNYKLVAIGKTEEQEVLNLNIPIEVSKGN